MSMESDSSTTGESQPTLVALIDSNSATSSKVVGSPKKSAPTPLINEIPLSKEELNAFTNNILSGTLKLLDQMPETVYKCCELLIAVAKRNGDEWFVDMISQLIGQITILLGSIIESTFFVGDQLSIERTNQLFQQAESSQLYTRIHLLALLFNEMKKGCCTQISRSDQLLTIMVEVLERSAYILTKSKEAESKTSSAQIHTPKWMAPLVLIIDLYQKYSVALKRREQLLATNSKRVWMYFDDRPSKWQPYSQPNNKAIDEAFVGGEQSIKIVAMRRRYTIQFNHMVQLNDETGSFRPIMFFSEESKESKSSTESAKDETLVEKGNIVDNKTTETSPPQPSLSQVIEPPTNIFSEEHCRSVMKSLVALIKLPTDSETLHAVMRLCLRLTRDYNQACLFAELGGISTLLNLPKSSQFVGFASLSTLIIRHVIEDTLTMKIVMEKMLRQQTSSSLISSREMHYMFRFLNPAACRDMDLFKVTAKTIFRMSVYNRRFEENDSRVHTYILRSIPQKLHESVENNQEISTITKAIIYELLNLLPHKQNNETNPTDDEPMKTSDETSPSSSEHDNSVFSASSILSLLAELVRSYNVVAKTICEYSYPRGYTNLITDDCTALSFILDNLLHSAQTFGDKDCPTSSKVLFASLASISHCNEVQTIIVTEIKNSLSRAVLLPETMEKHSKIQALSSLITVIVESNTILSPSQTALRVQGQPPVVNNFVTRLLVKKAVINDLARVIQSIDLSSPTVSPTVNSLLKTLEYLTKIINSPQNMMFPSRQNRSTRHEQSNNQANQDLNDIDFFAPRVQREGEIAMEEDGADGQSRGNDTIDLAMDALEMHRELGFNESHNEERHNMSQGEHQSGEGEMNFDLSNQDIDPDMSMRDDVVYVISHEGGLEVRNPRSGTFASDELRGTDEDDDEDVVMQHAHDDDMIQSRSEMINNAVNSNRAESGSSDDSGSEDEDSQDSSIEDEDDDDAVGSTPEDDHEEDDEEDEEDDQMDDEEEDEMNEDYLNYFFEDSDFVNNYVMNADEVFPPMMRGRANQMNSYPSFLRNISDDMSNDTAVVADNYSSLAPQITSTPYVLVHHPLLSSHMETAASLSNTTGASGTTSNTSQFHPLIPSSGAAPSSTSGASRNANRPRARAIQRAIMGNAPNANGVHQWHLGTVAQNNVFLQRLLGTAMPQDGFTTNLPRNFAVRVADFTNELNHFDILTNDGPPLAHHYSYANAVSSNNSTLGSIPSTLTRWYEEARVLEGEFMYDSIFLVKNEIVKELEKYRNEEMKEKLAKKKEEEIRIGNTMKTSNQTATNEPSQTQDPDSDYSRNLANSVASAVFEPTQQGSSLPNPEVSFEPLQMEVSEVEPVEMTTAHPTSSAEPSHEPPIADVSAVPPVNDGAINQSQVIDESVTGPVEANASAAPDSVEAPVAEEPTPLPSVNMTDEERAILGGKSIQSTS